jgi:hydrogenase expression/formation protein HypC
MCLAIPAKITKLGQEGLATVDILGVTREISVDLVPKAKIDDYVLVHAGFAIEVVDEKFAKETIELIEEFPELAAEELPAAAFGIADTVDAREGVTEIPAGGSMAAEFTAAFGDVPTLNQAK